MIDGMSRLGRAALLALAISGLASLAGTPPSAYAQRKKKPDPEEEAKKKQEREHYEKGILHYDLGEFDQAIAEFKAAYGIRGAPALLFNIAQAYRLKKDYEQALHFYKTFLRLRPDAPNRPDVEARIAEMEQLIADSNRVQGSPPVGTIPPEGTGTDGARDPRVEPAGGNTTTSGTGTTGTEPTDTTDTPTTGGTGDAGAGTTGTGTSDGAVASNTGAGSGDVSSVIGGSDGADTTITSRASRLPLTALVRVDAAPFAEDAGAAVVVGVGWAFGDHLVAHAAAIIGVEQGAWLGTTASFLPGSVRPRFTVGVPIFLTEGVLPGIQLGPGIEWRLSRRFALTLDLTFAHFPTAPDDIVNTVFLPTMGVQGRL